ncbi:MAG: hydroxyacid dehydrogenase [Candidatus Hydrothermota bacterium]|nr:MAG: hydroxyacid dehydrogenase [Candidatus Hydrothermae bacterium]
MRAILVTFSDRLTSELEHDLKEVFEPDYEVVVLGRPDAESKFDKVVALLIFQFKGVVTPELLSKLPNLKVIQTITAGTDHIDRSILPLDVVVLSGSGANSDYIAEHVFALMLAAAKNIVFHTDAMRNGEFHQEVFAKPLRDTTLLIVGLGSIGCEVAKRAKCFGMKVVGVNRSGIARCEVDSVFKSDKLLELLPQADFIVISVALTPETKGLIGEKELAAMKDDAVLVNVSRGKVIDEAALYRHLVNHPNFKVGLDVWWRYPKENEKFAQHFPIEKLPNVIMTPHIAPKVPGFFERMTLFSARKLRSYLNILKSK